MFCPQCQSEYIPDIVRCPSCNVDLVPELPVASQAEYVDYEEVFETSDPQLVPVLKSVLDGAGITYFINGEEINRMYVPSEPIRLMARKDQAQQARDLIDVVEENYDEALSEAAAEGPAGGSAGEEPAENEAPEHPPSGKMKAFMIGMVVGILLAGSYAAYHIYSLRHFSGIKSCDFNKDGKADSWLSYQNGIRSTYQVDRNFDGKVDEWAEYDKGKIVRSQVDNDFNGIPDITYYYVDEIVDSAEAHPNGSAIIIKKEYYEHGVLKEEWVDTNYDGKFDEKNSYDFLGTLISSSLL